jgi:hypothetical protein
MGYGWRCLWTVQIWRLQRAMLGGAYIEQGVSGLRMSSQRQSERSQVNKCPNRYRNCLAPSIPFTLSSSVVRTRSRIAVVVQHPANRERMSGETHEVFLRKTIRRTLLNIRGVQKNSIPVQRTNRGHQAWVGGTTSSEEPTILMLPPSPQTPKFLLYIYPRSGRKTEYGTHHTPC